MTEQSKVIDEPQYCEQTHCLRKVFQPFIYCDKHQDRSSTPYYLGVDLETILLKYGNRVLDVRNGKENPTLGELIDTPAQELEALVQSRISEVLNRLERTYRRIVPPIKDSPMELTLEAAQYNRFVEDLSKFITSERKRYDNNLPKQEDRHGNSK